MKAFWVFLAVGVAVLGLAVLADATVLPVLLNGRPGTHLALGVAVVIGLRRGSLWGLGVGWMAALLRGSLSLEPLGLTMLVFGLAGIAAGLLRRLSALCVPMIDVGLVLGILGGAELVASLLAAMVYGAPMRFGVVGVVVTAILATVALFVWPPDEEAASGARQRPA